jgi:hypothetical protein
MKGYEPKTKNLKSSFGPAPAYGKTTLYDSERAAIAPGAGRAYKNWGVARSF